ncbi:MAG: nucleotidyltransferase domain-containing protein [Bacteroidota bacterium]|nr:nucleotidyltransferase domain-containing protein [Bacteroidota bacterium]
MKKIKHKPKSIALFGSYARGNRKVESDLDILVSFKNSISLLKLVHLENMLSEKLGIKVDLPFLEKQFKHIKK